MPSIDVLHEHLTFLERLEVHFRPLFRLIFQAVHDDAGSYPESPKLSFVRNLAELALMTVGTIYTELKSALESLRCNGCPAADMLAHFFFHALPLAVCGFQLCAMNQQSASGDECVIFRPCSLFARFFYGAQYFPCLLFKIRSIAARIVCGRVATWPPSL